MISMSLSVGFRNSRAAAKEMRSSKRQRKSCHINMCSCMFVTCSLCPLVLKTPKKILSHKCVKLYVCQLLILSCPTELSLILVVTAQP